MPDGLCHWVERDVVIVTRPFFSGRVGSGHETIVGEGTTSVGALVEFIL